MNEDEITCLYDDDYAACYEKKFLLSPLTLADSTHEVKLLGELLKPGSRWLDVACGTGYFLSHFPRIERVGLDLSPAMLRIARENNPGVDFVEASYLAPSAAWEDRFGLVSLMWYAYGLVDTIDEIAELVANLARWTSPAGTCFVPLVDPALIAGIDIPYRPPSGFDGAVTLDGIIWSYSEDRGAKVHARQIAPSLPLMVEIFERFFEDVSLVRYPPAFPDWTGRPAVLATRKRADRR